MSINVRETHFVIIDSSVVEEHFENLEFNFPWMTDVWYYENYGNYYVFRFASENDALMFKLTFG